MYPFFTCAGKMKVSSAMPLMNFIAADWSLKMGCLTPEQKMVSFGRSSTIAKRILKNSARNN